MEIKKGIPIPPIGNRKYTKIFKKMDVGDCFDLQFDQFKHMDPSIIQSNILGCFRNNRIEGKVTTRVIRDEKVVRVWRVE